MTKERKEDHIALTDRAQTPILERDSRFNYEPLFSSHEAEVDLSLNFLGKRVGAPLWISSMTGGTDRAEQINKTLAQAAAHFSLGMGLGSCRSLLESSSCYFEQFNLRPILGDELPFYANLGIGQIEKLLDAGEASKIKTMVQSLSADGLIVHINPLQEWYQPEGDRFKYPPIETLKRLLNEFSMPLIVKEVGQGFGPESLKALLAMPLAGIEFGAFGGTNFSKLECLRAQNQASRRPEELCFTGHGPDEMVTICNTLLNELGVEQQKKVSTGFVVSGGVNSFLDGHYFTEKLEAEACYGQASKMLAGALKGIDELRLEISKELEGLKMAKKFLKIVKESK